MREVGGSGARPLSLRDSRSSLQDVKVPVGSGWRSCAAALQLPEFAAAVRWAGKLASAFLQLAAGGSALDTPPPRYVRARPRCAAAHAGTPLGASLAPHASRPRALQAARCLLALRRARCLPHGRDRSGLPDPCAGKGGVGQAAGVRDPCAALRGGGRSGWAALGAMHSAREDFSTPSFIYFCAVFAYSCGERRQLPIRRVTASVGKICRGFALSWGCRGCAPGLAHCQELRSARAAPAGCAPCGQRRALQP